jgi:rubrerythrin
VVEEIHHGLYQKALETLTQGKDMENAVIYVCPVCGNTVIGQAPDKCHVCGVPKEKFIEVK